MSDIHKSRNRIAGRKIDPELFDAQIKQAIADRVKAGVYSTAEIGRQLGKHRSTIQRYVSEMVQDPKWGIQLTETHRIVKAPSLVENAAYAELDTDAFVQRYPSVKHWVDDLQVRKGGKAIRKWRAHLNNVKTVCDVLKVTPEQLIASRQIAEDFTKSFVLEWRKEHTTSPREYIMALRNYAMDAGIVWARGVNGIMSGKKEGFGKYAGVKMTEDQINNAIDLAWAMGELDTAYWIAIGKETCARHHALEEIRIDTLEECGDYLTLKAFESKTQKTWVKYIVDPAVQALVRTRIANRQTSGKSTMFDPNDGDKVNKVLKTIYGKLGLTDPYFQQHPTHALRHVGAHHWLRITGYNYALVAKIGGWDDVGTLIKCYGEMPGDVLIAELHRARAAI